jgi:hypothetical protein
MNNVKTQYDHNNLAPLLISGATALWGFFGSQGDVLKNAIPIFYSTLGGVVGIVSGILSALWIAKTTIEVGVKTTYSNSPGSTYKTYGGNSIVGDLLGFTETVYLVAFILLAAGTVSAPMELAFKMDEAFAKSDAANAQSMQYTLLTYGILIAIGSFLGATAINKSAELLLGFFDRQQTNAGTLADASSIESDKVTSLNAMLVDSIHHTLTIIAYYTVAVSISGGSYYYVYKNIVPTDDQAF